MGGKQQIYDRLSDYSPTFDPETGEHRDDSFVRWLSTGGHRSNGPVMSYGQTNVNVLFIGGPKDGQRERMHSAPERFYVEQIRKVSDSKDKLSSAPLVPDKVVYIKTNLTGHTVYFAHQDLDYDKHPVEQAVAKLIENYKAIS